MNTTNTKEIYPNILKVRDDHQPIWFGDLKEDKFKISEDSKTSWAGEDFGINDLRRRIEPWLTSLFSPSIFRSWQGLD